MTRFARDDGSPTPPVSRRAVLGGVAGGLLTLTAIGSVGASEERRYVVTADGAAVGDRIEDAGFSVRVTLARGTVYGVLGPADERDTLEDIDGVEAAAEGVRFEFEGSALDGESTDEEPPAFSALQWDKQDITTDAFIAHERSTGAGTKIAIVDSGVQADHPDLEANVVTDEWRSYDRFGNVALEGKHRDRNGHGTHVAGIAAASGDRVAGTAPDADIVSLRVLNKNLSGTFLQILAAIEDAADIGADAANLSLGTPPLPPTANRAFRGAFERVINDATRRGTVVVNSAGNDATNLDSRLTVFPGDAAGAMAVSATGPNDERAFYSNFGTSTITVGAPGGGYETPEKTFETDPSEVEYPFPTNYVLSTYPTDTTFYLAGTSMAAPQVAGTVGLIREVAPEANARQVQKAIEQGAERARGESSDDLGAGRLNCDEALDAPVLNGKGRN